MFESAPTEAGAVWLLRLREAANELAGQLVEADHVSAAREILYEKLREITRDSWTNGLKAGRARARKQAVGSAQRS